MYALDVKRPPAADSYLLVIPRPDSRGLACCWWMCARPEPQQNALSKERLLGSTLPAAGSTVLARSHNVWPSPLLPSPPSSLPHSGKYIRDRTSQQKLLLLPPREKETAAPALEQKDRFSNICCCLIHTRTKVRDGQTLPPAPGAGNSLSGRIEKEQFCSFG